jgi:WD40 repeat protein
VTSDREDLTYELDASDLRVMARHPAGGVTQTLAPDGRTLALAGRGDGVRLLDLRTSRTRAIAAPPGEVQRMAFTPDGATLASVTDSGTLTLSDVRDGKVEQRYSAHAGGAGGIAVTPDGRIAITAGIDGRVALWSLAGSRLLRPIALRRPFVVEDPTPRGVAMSPDGDTVAVGEIGGVDLIDSASLQRRSVLRTGSGPALAVDFSPDGRLMAVTSDHGRVGLWDAHTLKPAGRLTGLRSWTQAVAFSPDGRLVAAGDTNDDRPTVRIWDVASRTPTRFRVGLSAAGVAFSPDGRLLAVSTMEHKVEVRDVRTGRLVKRLHTAELARSVAFSPDGRLLFVGLLNGAGQFYTSRDWRPEGVQFRGQDQRLLSARFTPDGRTLATASADGTVMLWDVASRKPIGAPVEVKADSFVAAVLSRDGANLYAFPSTTKGLRLALSPAVWKQEACAIAGRQLTAREWADALPGRPYRRVC